ncbi:MAG TPA: RNHCP domain-containing protein [Candidatus Merdisoma faecalis]|nr:RNHCP domain-containing protein [Candidatus Merdisoma faecalis]
MGYPFFYCLSKHRKEIRFRKLAKRRENKKMKTEQKPYRCPVCGWQDGAEEDRLRTHCPNCLSGLHGEREDGLECGGVLEPVGIWVKSDKEWEIIQRCRLCGEMTSDPMSAEDNPVKILSIASKPLSEPPFPVERMEELTRMMGGRGDMGGYYHEQRK